ncbi:MAG: ATP-dependent DNA helicase [Actinobacteria bacterium]|nr:ATP-dependent DNA helicase [Actinomycetota bacterium]
MPEVGELLDRVIGALPDGEDRPQQRAILDAVAAAFRDHDHLAVQGPTGVGKSLGYLIPAVARAADGHRTVVVTSSRALQDQLAGADLPFLSEVLQVPFRHAVLKGRANYLCQAAVQETIVQLGRGGEQGSLDLDSTVLDSTVLDSTVLDSPTSTAAVRDELEALLEWASSTTTGELNELVDPPSDPAWAAVSVGPGECVGPTRCAHVATCFSEQARERAARADLVVVNAHLYAAHVESGAQLLPPHDQVVIDEAHEFEDAVVAALGVSVTGWRLRNLVRVHDRCVAERPTVAMALGRAADVLDEALGAAFRSSVAEHGSGRLKGALPDPVAQALDQADLAVDGAVRSLRETAKAAQHAERSAAAHRFERAIRTAEAVADDLHLLGGGIGAGQLRWISEGRSGRHSLQLTRIDIASTLRSLAWEREEDAADTDEPIVGEGPDGDPLRHRGSDGDAGTGPTVVLCSATLDPGTAARLGLHARYLSVDSPFDFRRNALLYVPRLPTPGSGLWPEAVLEEVLHVLERCEGRTLALFTSHRMLRRTVDAARSRLPDRVLLAQGDAPNGTLQRRFLDEEHTSLFATASFWTGISSPGTTCSAVVVDKIPFPVPTDPIVEARCDAVGADRAFMEISVPAAAMQLAQGVGRLIRTTTDRGVVAVLDPRLAESRYRARILDRLPRMMRTRERAELDEFIDSLGLGADLSRSGS